MTATVAGHDNAMGYDSSAHRKHFDWVIAVSVGIILAFAALTIGLVVWNTNETRQVGQENQSILKSHSKEYRVINAELAALLTLQKTSRDNHTQTYAILVSICQATPGCEVPK